VLACSFHQHIDQSGSIKVTATVTRTVGNSDGLLKYVGTPYT